MKRRTLFQWAAAAGASVLAPTPKARATVRTHYEVIIIDDPWEPRMEFDRDALMKWWNASRMYLRAVTA